MASISQLTLKTLVEVLKDLRGGSIGFDPFRDDRTSNKAKMLAFILKEYSNDVIIAAISRVTATQSTDHTKTETISGHVDHRRATDCAVIVEFKDINGYKHVVGFDSHDEAQNWIGQRQSHQYLGKWENHDYPNTRPSPAAPKAPVMPVAHSPNIHVASETTQIATLLASLAQKNSVDATQVEAIMDKRAQSYVDNILDATNKRLAGYDAKIDSLQMPVTVHVLKTEHAKPVDMGHQHKAFPTLLKMSQARTKDGMRLNIWLKGPAGSGKTTAAKKVSEALEMQFQFNGAISTEYELMGFKDASGAYHRTAFREIFENGGVYLFDEVDSSLPKAVLAFNAALANGECRFPDGMINRHPDCIVIAGANTAGNGANSDYVGRMKQDLAFLNRFVMLDWPLDEALEKALASNKDWVRKVQRLRANAVKRSIKGHIISPRATFYGEALLAAGIDEETVEQACIRGALSQDQWESLCI